ncbi:MAG: SDR family NAD(P)-dependent oxidoreductase [Haloarculaceae archaeon]
MTRTAVVAGVGPGLGASIARRFADEGLSVGLFARSTGFTESLAADLDETAGAGLAVPVDVADPDDVARGFDAVREAFGSVDVLVCNASAATWQGARSISPDEFDRAFAVGARGGLLCVQAALDDMDDGGTVVFTGATSAVRGREGAVGFSAAKFAVRGLAQSLARELGPEGIHVAHVVVDGQIRPPDAAADESYLDPDAVAERYWHLVEQDDVDTMDFEVHVTNGTQSIEFL